MWLLCLGANQDVLRWPIDHAWIAPVVWNLVLPALCEKKMCLIYTFFSERNLKLTTDCVIFCSDRVRTCKLLFIQGLEWLQLFSFTNKISMLAFFHTFLQLMYFVKFCKFPFYSKKIIINKKYIFVLYMFICLFVSLMHSHHMVKGLPKD